MEEGSVLMNDLKCPYCGQEMIRVSKDALTTGKYVCETCGKRFGLKSNGAMNDCDTFYFTMGGFHQGFKSILIEERDSYADITLTPSLAVSDKAIHLRITLNEWQNIKDTLFQELFVLSWDEEYYDPYILDGTQWELKLTFDSRRDFEISGSNVFPKLFDDLLNYLKIYFEQVE
ncbi:MAG: hypothetical protein ACTHVM_07940 [Alkalibacterium gilvum]